MVEDAVRLIALGETAEEDRVDEVIAEIYPVSRDEVFAAGQLDMTARHKVVVWAEEYSGQDEVIYNGDRFTIYRTYGPTDANRIELYVCERKGNTPCR